MEKKTLIRLATFVVIIICGLIIIENSIRGIGNLIENKKENEKQEAQKNLYENSEQYREEVLLEGVINDFVKLLNNNDIESLYNLVDEDYRDYKFQNNIESFKEYLKQYVKSDSQITLQTYEKISGRYVCRLLSEYDGNLKSFVTLIEEKEDGSYSIIFDNITGIEKVNKTYVSNLNLKCEVMYKITSKNICIYTIEFTNSTGKDINYEYDSIELRDTFGNSFKIDTENLKISLKNGESMRQDLVFYDDKIHRFPKTYLNINLKDEQNNIKSLSIYLETSM